MPDPNPVPPASRRRTQVAACLAAAAVLTALGCYYAAPAPAGPDPDPLTAPTAPPTVGSLPLFATWPKDLRPDLALVLSGQTYGYLSPCGCSRPQTGGLERRANLIAQLKAKGWAVAGLDLGDIAPPKGVHKQNLLKYATTMTALREMGYVAVGLGEYDFATQLFDLLMSYTLKNAGKPPVVLAANLEGVTRGPGAKVTQRFPRAVFFPPADQGGRPMVEAVELVAQPGEPAFGVVSVIGPTVATQVVATAADFDFARNAQNEVATDAVLRASLAALAAHPKAPELRVLLYVGKLAEARRAAEAHPQFQLVLCQSDDAEPPAFSTVVNGGRTHIVQVGHKGRSVGVVGVFRAGAGYDLRYQLVPLTEEYLTLAGAEKGHAVLELLEKYALEVKDEDLLRLHTAKQIQHAVQIQKPDANVKYVGSDACKSCHPAEFDKWSQSPHSHAYETLEKKATRPSNRQFDGECLICHTTGMEFKTGFVNAKETPHLKNNGCENCHGPGSAHSAAPNDKALFAALSPWKTAPTDRLPDAAVMERIGKLKPSDRAAQTAKLPPAQVAVANAVFGACAKCHDTENDPKFDIYSYWPKVTHSGLKGQPAGGAAAK